MSNVLAAFINIILYILRKSNQLPSLVAEALQEVGKFFMSDRDVILIRQVIRLCAALTVI